jgi:hypothetical protein
LPSALNVLESSRFWKIANCIARPLANAQEQKSLEECHGKRVSIPLVALELRPQ